MTNTNTNTNTDFLNCYTELTALGVPMFHHEASGGYDEEFILSAEMEDSLLWLDYYQEMNSWGGETINPQVEAIAKKHGLYIEWQNAGAAKLYRA